MVFYADSFATVAVVLFLHLVHGDHFIIADTGNGRLQLCAAASRGGPCETVGSGLVSHHSVAVDNAGDFVVADEHQIKLCLASSPGALCETVVGFNHLGDSATEVSSPHGVFWDPWRYYVIANTGNNRVQRCVAGILHARCDTVTDGLNGPHAVVMDGNGDYVISDTFNHRVRRCDGGAPSPYCWTVAGSGSAFSPNDGSGANELSYPSGLAIDEDGRYVIADCGNHRIQRCTASFCDTVAGTSEVSGSGQAELYRPRDVALDAEGNYLIADTGNHRIQLCPFLSPGSPCQTVAGTGFGGSGPTELSWPRGVAWVPRRTTSTTATTSSSQSTSFATTPSKSAEAPAVALVSRGRQSSVQVALVSVVTVAHCLV